MQSICIHYIINPTMNALNQAKVVLLQDEPVATLHALSPAAIAQELEYTNSAGVTVRLTTNEPISLEVMQQLVQLTSESGSCSKPIHMGSIVRVSPGWPYMLEFHQAGISFSVETLRATHAVCHAGAAMLVGQMLYTNEPERLGVAGIFMNFLALNHANNF